MALAIDLKEDRAKYERYFVKGKRKGIGVHTFPFGKIYEREFHENMKHRKDKIKYPDGSEYCGDFLLDLK